MTPTDHLFNRVKVLLRYRYSSSNAKQRLLKSLYSRLTRSAKLSGAGRAATGCCCCPSPLPCPRLLASSTAASAPGLMVRSDMAIAGEKEPSASLLSLEKTLASLLVFLRPISPPLPLPPVLVLVPLPVPEGQPRDLGARHLQPGIGTCARGCRAHRGAGIGGRRQ